MNWNIPRAHRRHWRGQQHYQLHQWKQWIMSNISVYQRSLTDSSRPGYKWKMTSSLEIHHEGTAKHSTSSSSSSAPSLLTACLFFLNHFQRSFFNWVVRLVRTSRFYMEDCSNLDVVTVGVCVCEYKKKRVWWGSTDTIPHKVILTSLFSPHCASFWSAPFCAKKPKLVPFDSASSTSFPHPLQTRPTKPMCSDWAELVEND